MSAYGAMPSSLIDIATATAMVERAGLTARVDADGRYLGIYAVDVRSPVGRTLITDGEVSRFTVERMLR